MVAKVEILVVSFDKLFFFSSAMANRMIFFACAAREPSAGCEEGHKGF